MFEFFLRGYRSGLLSFCGSQVDVCFDVDGDEGKFCFRKFENGQYKPGEDPITRHPNILSGVIMGKKAWGLWKDQWTDGIVDWTFTREEILGEFESRGITIPEPFIREFDNLIEKKRKIRNQGYYEELIGRGIRRDPK